MRAVTLRLMLGGMKSYFPWLSDFTGTGGTTSAEYCYAVWLRHLVLANDQGLSTTPETLVELGPGDSIGVGLAALLCGAERYRALDVVAHAALDRNLELLDQLHAMLTARAPIPGDDAFPLMYPKLPAYDFPSEVLSEERLAAALAPARVEALRAAVRGMASADPSAPIRYICPWNDPSIVEAGTADWVLGQGVLQDVEAGDLPAMLDATHRWLKPGGFTSHQIDFSSTVKTGAWNNHWAHTDLQWRLIRGKRPYYVNRVPLSTYLKGFAEQRLQVVAVRTVRDRDGLPRQALAPRFRRLDEQDRSTRAAFVLAVRS